MEYLSSISCKDKQYLTYRNDKLEPEDGHTLESYGIEEGSMIFVNQIGEDFRINIRFPTGETIQFFVNGMDTIERLKLRFYAIAWVPRGKGAEF